MTVTTRLPSRRDIHRRKPRQHRSRPLVAAAVAIVALGSGTAVAATSQPAADLAASPAASAPATSVRALDEAASAPDASPVRADPSAAAATAAVKRARDVVAENEIGSQRLERITATTEQVTELLAERDEASASRSSDRGPLPATTETGGPADAELAEATGELITLLDRAEQRAVRAAAAPETPQDIRQEQRDEAAAAAAELAEHVDSVASFSNGRIPADRLCALGFAPNQILRCDAAAQLERLDVAYHARFGEHLTITDSYRSYEGQVAARASRGHMAAVPGHSNHGWGVAVDFGGGVERFGTAQYEWLRKHGPDFGWDNPGWARPDGRKPEAWHWEYEPLS